VTSFQEGKFWKASNRCKPGPAAENACQNGG